MVHLNISFSELKAMLCLLSEHDTLGKDTIINCVLALGNRRSFKMTERSIRNVLNNNMSDFLSHTLMKVNPENQLLSIRRFLPGVLDVDSYGDDTLKSI